ncbi:hypothetical protein [Nostoc sp. NMS4]|uniref:hypothetical protein n=1 Tax=Nostoc sp. NMS4 TaxID=2815390 RepID=UPI0025F7E540|nr:hypothetical protein [Nostoc sp. NMS4]MBN3925983.1 hypothetical protein [Nostoc sp. NMS4]
MMFNQASEYLKQNAERIMQIWEVRARYEVAASIHQVLGAIVLFYVTAAENVKRVFYSHVKF